MPQILKRFFASSPPSTPADSELAACGSVEPTAPPAKDVPGTEFVAMRLVRAVEEAECKLQEVRDAWRRRWEQDAVRLACRIASRCLRELPFDSVALAQQLVDESLRGVRLEGGCEVRLNPEDYRLLTEQNRMPARDVVVLPDSSVAPGGCVVRTPDGVIDQTLDAQLRRVEQELTDI